ncbi:MAG: hypothetical protein ABI898_10020 [Sphingomonadales bacterium]
MLWKSAKQRKAETFERALQEMLPAALQVAEKWRLFEETVKFHDDILLSEQVRMFSFPLADFFRKAYPNISKTDSFVYLATLLIGVYLAKTHPIPEVLGVARHLDEQLGAPGIEQMLHRFIQGTPNH